MPTYKEILENHKKGLSKLVKETKINNYNEAKTYINNLQVYTPEFFSELCFVFQSNLNLALKPVDPAEDFIVAMKNIISDTIKDELMKTARKLV